MKSGHPDVVTDRFAIEIDRVGNWKEGLGRAYGYAIDTEKIPVLALMRPVERTDFEAANNAGELRTRYAERFRHPGKGNWFLRVKVLLPCNRPI